MDGGDGRDGAVMAGDDRTCDCWTVAWLGTQPSVVCGGGIPLGGTPVGWTLHAFGSALCTCRCSPLTACPVHRDHAPGSRSDFAAPGPLAGQPMLSEADVERIAKRVVELLKASP